ncbi:sialidase family protein [Streptomyces sp. NPDC002994]|uniref:sialidase family protein n=1 Tax=Streptomyces sp. NPDC002994 TaxID=3154441 RepID=UPI0033AD340D
MPYRSGASGYHTFRIPAALQVPGGALLAFAEGRRDSAADNGDIDLVLRRSLDGGCTWQPLQLVADAGKDTVGNPVPVIDPRSGDIVLVTCRTIGGATKRQVTSGRAAASVRRVYVQRSTDGGRTWSPQRDITESVKPSDWRWYAVGPGHAVALRHGRHRGRLLVPANHSAGTTGRSGGHSLYSDDGGHTWRVGYVSRSVGGPLALNESTLAELPDGTVYINARDHDRTAEGTRADAYSADGGLSLAVPFRPQPQLTGPTVQGSVLQVSGRPWRGPLLYSGPSDPGERLRMQVRASDDGGRSWRPVRSVSDDRAGYSDLVQTSRATVGLLYETGLTTYHDTIRFTRLPLGALSAAR